MSTGRLKYSSMFSLLFSPVEKQNPACKCEKKKTLILFKTYLSIVNFEQKIKEIKERFLNNIAFIFFIAHLKNIIILHAFLFTNL